MAVDAGFVRRIFAGLEQGDGAGFFAHVADDVDWTVMGTHPLAGRYASKADFVAGTFAKLGKVLPHGAQLHVDELIVTGDVAIVELHSEATAKSGFGFDNHYCWICYFRNDVIIRVRAYLDSVMVARLFEEIGLVARMSEATSGTSLRQAPDIAALIRATGGAQLPLNTGLRFSMKACTASLWSAVVVRRVSRSAS